MKTPVLVTAAAGMLLGLSAAQRPALLTQARSGMWEIDGLPGAAPRQRQCLADLTVLANFEHRSKSCTRVIINDSPSETVIHYTCAGGGFGRTKMTLITPRSLRVETQGISDNAPFNYVLQARRVGDCQTARR